MIKRKKRAITRQGTVVVQSLQGKRSTVLALSRTLCAGSADAAATSVNPCTGARSATSHGTSVAADLPGCRSSPGAQTRGFSGNSRQAGPVRPVYDADQSMAA
jgi:hypothetical protein